MGTVTAAVPLAHGPQPRYATAEMADVRLPEWGWRLDAPGAQEKLVASLRRWGQLRPLVVRITGCGTYEVVRGRGLYRALQQLGVPHVMVVSLGALPTLDAQRAALALELQREVDYPALALAVADMLAAGDTPSGLSAATPFTPERLAYFGKLAAWDWSQYAEQDGQQALWQEGEDPATLAAVSEPLAPETAVEAVEAVLETLPLAAALAVVQAVAEDVRLAEAASPEPEQPAALAHGRRRKAPAAPPQPSLLDGLF